MHCLIEQDISNEHAEGFLAARIKKEIACLERVFEVENRIELILLSGRRKFWHITSCLRKKISIHAPNCK